MSGYTWQSGVSSSTTSGYCPICGAKTITEPRRKVPIVDLCCSPDHAADYREKIRAVADGHIPRPILDEILWKGTLPQELARRIAAAAQKPTAK